MKAIKYFLFISVIIILTGCAPKYSIFKNVSDANLLAVQWEEVEGFENDDLKAALETFKTACKKSIKKQNLENVCKKAGNAVNAREFFITNFMPYLIYGNNNSDTGLITGYYEPLLHGSRNKTDRFKYPIFKVPQDLIVVDLDEVYPELSKFRLRGKVVGNRLIPYPSRQEIPKIADQLKPICYVDDKIDLFFLQIQGSGKVRLDDGSIINVGYAGQNGRKYFSIGRKLIETGAIKAEDISLQSIKKWLNQNPDKVDEVLNLNKSYVFFTESKKGATGSLGVELIAKRNLAVDKKYIPLGFPVFIQTDNPLTKKPINRLMVAADTGGAIKGEIRADFFWGFGKNAEELAGKMKQKGKLYLILPKEIEKI